jgi:DNA repair protein REV1
LASTRYWISLGHAKELCPDLETISYDFSTYEKISKEFYSILISHFVRIQVVSIDEAFVEIGYQTREKLANIVNKVRDEIRQKTNCNASVGVGANILLARIATKKAKPDGWFWLTIGDGSEGEKWFKQLDVKELPGVGKSWRTKFEKIGITTVSELRSNVSYVR